MPSRVEPKVIVSTVAKKSKQQLQKPTNQTNKQTRSYFSGFESNKKNKTIELNVLNTSIVLQRRISRNLLFLFFENVNVWQENTRSHRRCHNTWYSNDQGWLANVWNTYSDGRVKKSTCRITIKTFNCILEFARHDLECHYLDETLK